jgi:hypothetical protein
VVEVCSRHPERATQHQVIRSCLSQPQEITFNWMRNDSPFLPVFLRR